jgi:hypothetical protein
VASFLSQSHQGEQALPGLTYLRNGRSVDLRDPCSRTIRVAGVGGCYGPSNYGRRSDELQGYAKRHYTSDEIECLVDTSSVDIVLTHACGRALQTAPSWGRLCE